jgi:mRNA degradation ribonuclease J1/J2
MVKLSSPPFYAKHFTRAPLVQLPGFGIFKPDTLVSGHIQSQMMVFEIAVISAFCHVHVDGSYGEWAAHVKVHAHVCGTYSIRV